MICSKVCSLKRATLSVVYANILVNFAVILCLIFIQAYYNLNVGSAIASILLYVALFINITSMIVSSFALKAIYSHNRRLFGPFILQLLANITFCSFCITFLITRKMNGAHIPYVAFHASIWILSVIIVVSVYMLLISLSYYRVISGQLSTTNWDS